MGRRLVPRFLPVLDIATLDDKELHDLVAGIDDAQQTCPIIKGSQPLQTCIGELVKKDAALTASTTLVVQDRAKLAKDLGAEAEDRSDLEGELRTYVSLFVNLAKSPADLLSGGLTPQPVRPPKNQPPEVPEQLVNKPPKHQQGRTVVSVVETGPTRHQYVAQESLDGGVTWTQLGVSHGKTRTVTGASGAKVWVRFAMIRGSLQSDWSTPIIVTIP